MCLLCSSWPGTVKAPATLAFLTLSFEVQKGFACLPLKLGYVPSIGTQAAATYKPIPKTSRTIPRDWACSARSRDKTDKFACLLSRQCSYLLQVLKSRPHARQSLDITGTMATQAGTHPTKTTNCIPPVQLWYWSATKPFLIAKGWRHQTRYPTGWPSLQHSTQSYVHNHPYKRK